MIQNLLILQLKHLQFLSVLILVQHMNPLHQRYGTLINRSICCN